MMCDCRYFAKCLQWNCLKDDCEFYEALDSLEPEELDEIDRTFREVYEMDFDRFKRLVDDVGSYLEQDAVVMTSLRVWERVVELRSGYEEDPAETQKR